MRTNDDTPAIAAMKKRIREKSAKFHEFLSNPVGKELIDIMIEEFDRDDLRGANAKETYYNLGARDVVVYLKTLGRIHDKTSEIHNDAT